MKYFSTFSGVGGFELGIDYDNRSNIRDGAEVLREDGTNTQERTPRATCVGHSEIDKYASAVLKYRFPNTKNYGDISKINWSEVPDFDLLVGGSPCQDLSVAGKRKGITGERSGLFAEFVRALKEKKPEYFIWENVKGALSSNQGWDFAEVQAQMAECGYELWWQVLNAKDFGVPQNRERIFVVGTRGECGREVLFERGDATQDTIANTIRTGGKASITKKHAWDLVQRQPLRYLNRNQKNIKGDYAFCVDASQTSGVQISKDSSKVVLCTHGKESQLDDGTLEGKTKLRREDECLLCLQDRKEDRDTPQERGLARQQGGESGGDLPELPPEGTQQTTKVQRTNLRETTQAERLLREAQPEVQEVGKSVQGKGEPTLPDCRVRRLTPLEAERLMSWPPNWTQYGDFDGEVKEISDSQRYKMCGNGVVSEVVKQVFNELIRPVDNL